MTEITVPVPDERVPDFYKWFGNWLQSPQTSSAPGATQTAPWIAPNDQDLAAELWAKLSKNGKAFFGFLIRRPGERFNGVVLARELGIPNGRSGVAGVLAWPGRYCLAMSKRLPSRWDEESGEYWMDPDVAAMFRKVMEA